ncbi:MAG: glycosyl transferase [Deltaproteobacteria bacterium HGW-Deltaproteobacteria-19]|nr:MAG: glycosyl transferase [Deltaproteobacteria bacterium HGW-Deltaproteobacteria-19]
MKIRPDISVIVPVSGEESVIGERIRSIRAVEAGESPEIIVVDGDPGGGTLKALAEPDVIGLLSPRGRAIQMNRGAERATGRILLFLHADTDLPNGAFTMIRRAMADESAAAGAFDLSIRSPRAAFRIIERVSSRRSRITRIPYGDQAIFLRSPYFREIGGYGEIPLMEDVELMRRIKRRGDRVVFLKARVSTSARRWEKEGILRCTLRNWALVGLFLLGVPAGRLARYYP